MSAMDRQLLTRIGKLPAGERLPLSALAREADATVAVVMSAIEALVAAGKLDRQTLRPPVSVGRDALMALLAKGPVHARTIAARQLRGVADALVAEGVAERCASPNATTNFKNMLRLVAETRAEHGAGALPAPATPAPSGAGNLHPVQNAPRSGAAKVGGGDARSEDAAPADSLSVGQTMARDLVAAWEASGMPITAFFAPLTKGPQAFLSALRKSRTNKAATIDKIVAFLADPPRASAEQLAAQQAKRPPRRAPHPPRMALGPESAFHVDRRRADTIGAVEQRRGGETIADAIRRCGREIEADEAGTTTGMARKREFPAIPADRWTKLAALAGELGKRRSEVLIDVIDAGILCVTEDLREGER